MRQAVTHTLALASLLGCLALSACGEKAKAEPASMDAITKALAAEMKTSICQSGRPGGPSALQTNRIVGVAQAPANNQTNAASSAANNAEMMDHSHIPVAVPDAAPSPKLTTTLTRDVMAGYNLQILTENYEMTAPPVGVPMEDLMLPRMNSASGFVQGHAHLYINGEKIQRVYGHNIHIPASRFKNGMNQLNITINNHAHMYWTSEEKQIISSLFINTDVEKLIFHQFESFPVKAK